MGGDGGFFSIIDFFSSASSSGLQRCSFLWILIDNSDALTECKPIQFCSFSSHDLIIGVRRSLRALQHQQPGLASAHIVDACWHPCAVGSKHSNAGCGECVMHHPRREPEPDKSGSVVMHVFFFFFFLLLSCLLCDLKASLLTSVWIVGGAAQARRAARCALIGGAFCSSIATIAW